MFVKSHGAQDGREGEEDGEGEGVGKDEGEGGGVGEGESIEGLQLDGALGVESEAGSGSVQGSDSPTSLKAVRATRGANPRPSTALKVRRATEKEGEQKRARGADSTVTGEEGEEGDGDGGEIDMKGGRDMRRIGESSGGADLTEINAGDAVGVSAERNNEILTKTVYTTETEKIQFFVKNEFPSLVTGRNEDSAMSMTTDPSRKSLKSASRNSKEIPKEINTEISVFSTTKNDLNSPKKRTGLNFFNDFGKEKGNERENIKEMEAEKEREREREKLKLKENKFEEERRNFESKILSLQQVVENQSKSVSDLRDLTASLRLGTVRTALRLGVTYNTVFVLYMCD